MKKQKQETAPLASVTPAKASQKKDPYKEVLDVLESYDEGCIKPTSFSAVDECCATANHSPSNKNNCQSNNQPCCSSGKTNKKCGCHR